MRKSLLAATAVAALLSSLSVAEALPVSRLVAADEAAPVMSVRDGCGMRRYFSPRFRRCVWIGRRY
jgi:hypothetical protein